MKAVDTGLYTALSADVGTAMGTVTGSLNNLGATAVYRMMAPQTASLPFVDEFVEEVDRETRVIRVRLPDGLLDG